MAFARALALALFVGAFAPASSWVAKPKRSPIRTLDRKTFDWNLAPLVVNPARDARQLAVVMAGPSPLFASPGFNPIKVVNKGVKRAFSVLKAIITFLPALLLRLFRKNPKDSNNEPNEVSKVEVIELPETKEMTDEEKEDNRRKLLGATESVGTSEATAAAPVVATKPKTAAPVVATKPKAAATKAPEPKAAETEAAEPEAAATKADKLKFSLYSRPTAEPKAAEPEAAEPEAAETEPAEPEPAETEAAEPEAAEPEAAATKAAEPKATEPEAALQPLKFGRAVVTTKPASSPVEALRMTFFGTTLADKVGEVAGSMSDKAAAMADKAAEVIAKSPLALEPESEPSEVEEPSAAVESTPEVSEITEDTTDTAVSSPVEDFKFELPEIKVPDMKAITAAVESEEPYERGVQQFVLALTAALVFLLSHA